MTIPAILTLAMMLTDTSGWRDTPRGARLEADGQAVVELACKDGRMRLITSTLTPIQPGRDVAVQTDGKLRKATAVADPRFSAAFTATPDWFEDLGKAKRLTVSLWNVSRDFPAPGSTAAKRLAALCVPVAGD